MNNDEQAALNHLIHDFLKYVLQLYNEGKITRKQYIEIVDKKVRYINKIHSELK